MKKVLFVAASAALVMSSCSNEISESFKTSFDERTPLTVSTYTPGLTRVAAGSDAVVVNDAALQAGGFWLAATAAGEEEDLISASLFTYSAGAWSSSLDEIYWPLDPTTVVSFYGFYNNSSEIAPEGLNTGTVALSPDGETDLMAVYKATSLAGNNGSSNVSLAFDHILAQVTFNVTPAISGYQYVIGDISVEAPYGLNYSLSEKAFMAPTDAVPESPTHTYAVNSGETSEQYLTSGDTITTTSKVGRTLMVTPGSCTLSITYQINVMDGNGGVAQLNQYKTASATFTAVAGKSNVLNISLSPDNVPLSVSASVNGWDATANNITPTLE